MQEKTILSGPGVFIGVSTTKAYPGKTILFYDGDRLVLGLRLDTPYPTRRGNIPGVEAYEFIRTGLRMRYPSEAEEGINTFISRG